jgi:hypothetical protein
MQGYQTLGIPVNRHLLCYGMCYGSAEPKGRPLVADAVPGGVLTLTQAAAVLQRSQQLQASASPAGEVTPPHGGKRVLVRREEASQGCDP